MADYKISERDAAAAITGAEIIGLIQSGGDVQATIDDVKDYITAESGGSTVTVKVSLTSPEILDLNVTPKVLVAAQGADTYINVLSVAMRYNWNSIAYTTNTTLRVEMGSFSPIVTTNTIIAGTDDDFIVTSPTQSLSVTGTPDWVNAPLRLRAVSGNPAAGDSTLDVYITYNVIEL
jgi:hypothetical protein